MNLQLFNVAVCTLAQYGLAMLSCKQIREFVDGHNIRRNKLIVGNVPGQPAATDMTYMIWDEELAEKAEKWASKNIYCHNADTTIKSQRFEVGENLHFFSSTNLANNLTVDHVLEAWFIEYKHYKYGPQTRRQSKGPHQVGHYTQMVWANSTRLGCGISQHIDGKRLKMFTVCNYGPPGNFVGQYPYSTEDKKQDGLICTTSCKRLYGSNC